MTTTEDSLSNRARTCIGWANGQLDMSDWKPPEWTFIEPIHEDVRKAILNGMLSVRQRGMGTKTFKELCEFAGLDYKLSRRLISHHRNSQKRAELLHALTTGTELGATEFIKVRIVLWQKGKHAERLVRFIVVPPGMDPGEFVMSKLATTTESR